MHRVFFVPDVSCAHCVAALEGAVGAVSGVVQVDVDLEAKCLLVDGEFDDDLVRVAVVDAGYEIAGVV